MGGGYICSWRDRLDGITSSLATMDHSQLGQSSGAGCNHTLIFDSFPNRSLLENKQELKLASE